MPTTDGAASFTISKQGGYNPIRPWVNIRIGQYGGEDENIYKVPFKYFKSLSVETQLFNTVPTMRLQLEDTSFQDLYPVLQRYFKGVAAESIKEGKGSITAEPPPEFLPDITVQWGVLGVTRNGSSRLIKSPVVKFKLLRVSEDLQQDKVIFNLECLSLGPAQMQASTKEAFSYTSHADLLQQIGAAWCVKFQVDENAPLAPPVGAAPETPPSVTVDRQRSSWFSTVVLPELKSVNGTGYYIEYGMKAGEESIIFLRERKEDSTLVRDNQDTLGVSCSNFVDGSADDLCLEWRDYRSRILNMQIDGSWTETLLWSGIALSNIAQDGTINYAEAGSGTPSGQDAVSVATSQAAQIGGFADEGERLEHKTDMLAKALSTAVNLEIEILGNPELFLGAFYKRAIIRIPLRSFEASIDRRGGRVHWASGPYRIEQVTHNLTESTYTTTLKLAIDAEVLAANK